MLSDGLLYFVEVTAVCLHFPNEKHPFVDITVRADQDRVYEHVPRFRLFQYPDERALLCSELNDASDRMLRYAEEQTLSAEDEPPELGLL